MSPVAITGPLFDLHATGRPDSSFVLAPNSIELRDLHGALLWHTTVESEDAPRLVAAGDFNGDGITDVIFRTLKTPNGAATCGAALVRSTRLAFIDGASGAVTFPIAAMNDICWNGFGTVSPYTTHQWGTGTAYIGPLLSHAAAVVAAIPYYADEGWVVQWTPRGWKAMGTTASPALVYPSSAVYDRVYDAANRTPCSDARPGHCYVGGSHVANAVFLDPAQASGLLVLTSSRAFVYGSDMLPHSDLTWISGGRTDNAGRNYGLLERIAGWPDTYLMVGGCSVFNARSSMLAGRPVNGECSIHHHVEYFQLAGGQIIEHASQYFGYTGSDGVWESRIEYLLNAQSGFGGASAVVFNLYRNGGWRLVVMPDPSRPQATQEFPGWYAWDSIKAPDGRVVLVATRAPAGGGDASKVLPWEFDVLDWNGRAPVSVMHRDGLAPAVFAYPQSEWRHSSDGLPYGVYTLPAAHGIDLVVTDSTGQMTTALIDLGTTGTMTP